MALLVITAVLTVLSRDADGLLLFRRDPSGTSSCEEPRRPDIMIVGGLVLSDLRRNSGLRISSRDRYLQLLMLRMYRLERMEQNVD